MAVRSLKRNKAKNRMLLTAVILSVFLIFTVLTVGSTYMEMEKIQNIRQKGAQFDAVLVGRVTKKQLEWCRERKNITAVGLQAYSGYPEKTKKDSTLHSGLIWCDEVFWKKQMAPARDMVQGRYPQKENELMATRKSLKDCGMEHLGVGDSFEMTYTDHNGSHTKNFTISGIWDGYGDRQVFFVSKKFFEHSGYTLDQTRSGIMYLNFDEKYLRENERQEIMTRLNLGEQQYFEFSQEMSSWMEVMTGAAGLAAAICLSAYLLIYNILSLSVSANIRYYGLLETIGMTNWQIRKFLRRQMALLGAAGIAVGMSLGIVVSFRLIPFIVTALGIHQDDIHVVFHPAVFVLAVGVAAATIFMGNQNAIKTAGSVSPVDAMCYRGSSGNRKRHKTRRGPVLWKMALEQIGKNKKKSAVVILSLAASLSIFLCLTTLIQSHGARTVYTNYMNEDLIVQNDTLLKEEKSDWKQIMDAKFIDSVRKLSGVERVSSLKRAEIVVPWSGEITEMWLKKFYEKWQEEPFGEKERNEYKEHPERFDSFCYGISRQEFDYLKENENLKTEWKDFREGKTCLLYDGAMNLPESTFLGKTLTFWEDRQGSPEEKITIGDLVSEEYYGAGSGKGLVILISQDYMKEMAGALVFRMNISYKEPYDQETEQKVLQKIQETPGRKDFSYTSKIEDLKEARRAQGNMMGVGIGLTVIIAWIGIMNYINTVSGNISSRQSELALLEGIGMTKRQMRGMLVREGILYGLFSWLITAAAGIGITYVIYEKMNSNQIPFEIPWIWILGMAAIILMICALVPVIFYHIIDKKKSIIERIREIQ